LEKEKRPHPLRLGSAPSPTGEGFSGKRKNDLIRFAYAQHLLPPEKAFWGNEKRPHPLRLGSAPVSLRLGHGLALTVHRKVIHYQTAAFGYQPEKAFWKTKNDLIRLVPRHLLQPEKAFRGNKKRPLYIIFVKEKSNKCLTKSSLP